MKMFLPSAPGTLLSFFLLNSFLSLFLFTCFPHKLSRVPLDSCCGGVSEEQSDLPCEFQAEEGQIRGEEDPKAHRSVDTYGFSSGWNARRIHFRCFLSGTELGYVHHGEVTSIVNHYFMCERVLISPLLFLSLRC